MQSHESQEVVVDQVASPERRKMLGWLVAIINGGLFAALAGPVLGFIGSPLGTKRTGRWTAVLPEGDLPEGVLREVTYSIRVKDGYTVADHKYTVFLKRSGSEIVCMDPACTHLGCRVKLQERTQRFMCPCHGGVFDGDGKVVSGPPPKPLERHAAKIEGGQVWVYREV